MPQEVRIRCRNTGTTVNVPCGATLHELYRACGLHMEYGAVCALVNNRVEGMNYRVYNPKDVEFLDVRTADGMRTYTRTLFLVLAKAVEDLFPGSRLVIDGSVSGGYYCELRIGRSITDEDTEGLLGRMQQIVREDRHVQRVQCPREEAVELFTRRGMTSMARLLEGQQSLYASYYRIESTVDYFQSCLLTKTGQLGIFGLVRFHDGLLLRVPSRRNPAQLEPMVEQTKMYNIIHEQRRWQEILGIRTVGEFNEAVTAGRATELINVSEALQERKLSAIVDEIVRRGSRLVLVAGPSSSGKTTTSKRLAVQLMTIGLHPYTISTDDYYVNRVDTPRDTDGNYDFECIEAVDTDLFNSNMMQLLSGEEVLLPRYDFRLGERVYENNRIKIGSDDIVILEGNHALNPVMSSLVSEEKKFRIFASALTTIALDDHNCISTHDIRLIRRIVRDYKYRGYSALETIRRFPSVSAGEEKWIFPFQELADATFNSALLYELAVIKNQVMPILEQVGENEVEYAEASRLRRILQYFHSVPTDEVPHTSLLREFAGGSSFRY